MDKKKQALEVIDELLATRKAILDLVETRTFTTIVLEELDFFVGLHVDASELSEIVASIKDAEAELLESYKASDLLRIFFKLGNSINNDEKGQFDLLIRELRRLTL
jgi:hypothetical protein